MRRCSASGPPSNSPKTVLGFPTSIARSMWAPALELVVALAAQLLDGDVARGVDLGAGDDPGRAVLVPDPHVLHLQVEERVARLRDVLQVEVVAEVGRVLGEDAVAEEAEDGRVLLLQAKLEVGLELVQLVQVRHGLSLAPRGRAGSARGRGARGS